MLFRSTAFNETFVAPVATRLLAILVKPVVEPIVVVVEPANAVTVFGFPNNVKVPVELVLTVGFDPLILKPVALLNVTVGLATVNVPVLDPTLILVASPNAFIVNALLLNKLTVPVLVVASVGLAPL